MEMCCFPSESRDNSDRKEFAPEESNYFPITVDPVSEGIGAQKSKHEVTKVVFLVRNGGNSTKRIHLT